MAVSIIKKKSTVRINMAKTNSWTEKDFIKDIDMNSHAKAAIVKELKFRLRLTTPYRILKIQYFFTYTLNPNKGKIHAAASVPSGGTLAYLPGVTPLPPKINQISKPY